MVTLNALKQARSDAIDAFAELERVVFALVKEKTPGPFGEALKHVIKLPEFAAKGEQIKSIESLMHVRNDLVHAKPVYVQPKGGPTFLYRNNHVYDAYPLVRYMTLDAHESFTRETRRIVQLLRP